MFSIACFDSGPMPPGARVREPGRAPIWPETNSSEPTCTASENGRARIAESGAVKNLGATALGSGFLAQPEIDAASMAQSPSDAWRAYCFRMRSALLAPVPARIGYPPNAAA